jgi:DNA-binding CsgD family transcriptional regulator
VTARLVEGQTLRGIAEGMGVKLTTVRAHLAAVFGKTGTRRQAELVQRVLGGLAGIPWER